MEAINHITRVQDYAKNLASIRVGTIRHPGEFFDYQRVSRPMDMQEYMKRASYNIRYFSANYAIVICLLGVYSLLTNMLLLFAMGFMIGGFLAIGRFVHEPIEFAGKVITPQNLYIGLFVIGLPLLWWAAPLSTFFWLVGSSGCIVGAHAGLLEPGVESEYEGLETV
ncbi:ER to Golgi transport-related protein [Dioszegia hungarica]|uniref:PRA1 family protein n=1 Tax=Dioszegia hungarica TaxID=4972 RepID=A0AA38H4D5_9TREE|nr:ER to Golgi transport-related protein [Dioszegia hungarica]KAI9633500.1 ER to Golgi transport-related protein [Dioszegia hungarica]